MSKSKKPFIIAVCIVVVMLLAALAVLKIFLDSSAQSKRRAEMTAAASNIDSCCRIYLFDLIYGKSRWLDNNTDQGSESLFPEWGDDENTRREKAYEKTVGDALRYCSEYDNYANILNEFGVTYRHAIVYLDDTRDMSEINENISLTENTTLGEIYQ